MIGDLLLSGGGVDPNFSLGHNEIMLPASGPTLVQPCIESGIRPSSLASKISVISPKLAIAWAGDFHSAQRALKKIQINANNNPYSDDDLQELMALIEYEDLQNISLIALNVIGDGAASLHYSNVDKILESQEFGTSLISGSGSSHLERIIEDTSDAGYQPMYENGTHFPPTHDEHLKYLSRMNMLVSQLLAKQIIDSQIVNRGFGGFYERVYFDGQDIKRLDDVSFFYWDVIFPEMKIEPIPITIKSNYVGDTLIITRLQADFINGKSHNLDNRGNGFNRFIIPPIQKDIDDESIQTDLIKINRLNSKNHIHYFFLKYKGSVFKSISAPIMGGGREYANFKQNKTGSIRLKINNSFLNDISNFIRLSYRNRSKQSI